MNYEEQLVYFTKKYEELIETSNIAELQRMAEELKITISEEMHKFTELRRAVTSVGDEVPWQDPDDLNGKYYALADKISDARREIGCGIYVYSYSADGIIPWSESYC